jgi:glutathione S-transferase
MAIVLQHHPFSRAAHVVWMLEEVGVEYQLEFVDMLAGEQKKESTTRHNPMGKLPTLIDGDTVVTEKAAIALYLADRYAYGRLAPKVDDPARGTYYRWWSSGRAPPGPCARADLA